MSLKPFGKYTLVSKLGSGGMAEVYRAYPTLAPQKHIAIKRILPQFAKNRALVGMLVNEAKVTLGLDHPNVVPVIDFGMIDSTYFIAMEYIYGKDLRTIFLQLKAKGKVFPMPLAIYIMSCVLRGLDYAHHKADQFGRALQIVHRDISPQNIFVAFTGEVKVLDFGIAISTAKFDPAELGILKGKFSYMSPEQAYGKEVDPRTDIYSSGVVLWELLTMESCYSATVELELLSQVREGNIESPSQKNSQIPTELSSIIMKSLEKRMHLRYSTAGEFAEKLEEYLLDRYGPVSHADVAAFLRSIFNIDLSEIKQDPVLLKTRPEKKSATKEAPKDLSDILYAEDSSVPKYSQSKGKAPWLKKQNSIWTWDLLLIPVAIFVVGMIFTSDMTRSFFSGMQAKLRPLMSLVQRVKKPELFEKEDSVNVPLAPAPAYLYNVSFTKEAQSALEMLPFEIFEVVRNQILDLANSPRPAGAKKKSPKSNDWTVFVQNRGIIYEINEKRKIIHVKQITAPGR